TLDNFANQGAFCNPSNLGNCPAGSTDTQTFAFFQPNASKLRVGDQVYSFAFPPWRHGSWTGYVAMRSSTMSMWIEGNELVIDVDFQPLGGISIPFYLYGLHNQEVMENCINNFFDCFDGGFNALALVAPRAEIELQLVLANGQIGYNPGTVT